jgi:hypothetical protein
VQSTQTDCKASNAPFFFLYKIFWFLFFIFYFQKDFQESSNKQIYFERNNVQ